MSETGMTEAGMTEAGTGAAVLSRPESGLPGGRYGLRDAIAMEWLKLRSMRSTWWTLAVALAALIGLAILVLHYYPGHWAHMSRADRRSFDPTNSGFAGLALAQLAAAALGVLAVTGEYSSGMIRSTLAAVPRRGLVLAAKAAVVGAVALIAGEVGAFAAFLAGQAVLVSPAPHATLGQPGVLRAVLLGGAYVALIALIGLGVGMIVRRSAAGVAIIAGLIFVLPPVLLALPVGVQHAVARFLPEIIAEDSLTAVRPEAFSLSPWAGLGMLSLYAVVLLGIGSWLLARRDA
jgi:ABC-2 type transport system permease protein